MFKYFNKNEKPKYKNTKITDSEGNKFDSKKEYERYLTLSILQRDGHIHYLRRQVAYELLPSYKGIQQGVKYYADFVYVEKGKTVVEDVKSYITRKHPVYILKKKLIYHFYKIIIKEI